MCFSSHTDSFPQQALFSVFFADYFGGWSKFLLGTWVKNKALPLYRIIILAMCYHYNTKVCLTASLSSQMRAEPLQGRPPRNPLYVPIDHSVCCYHKAVSSSSFSVAPVSISPYPLPIKEKPPPSWNDPCSDHGVVFPSSWLTLFMMPAGSWVLFGHTRKGFVPSVPLNLICAPLLPSNPNTFYWNVSKMYAFLHLITAVILWWQGWRGNR